MGKYANETLWSLRFEVKKKKTPLKKRGFSNGIGVYL